MREVAAVAGVSLSTVSRALNDDPKVDAGARREGPRARSTMLGYRRDVDGDQRCAAPTGSRRASAWSSTTSRTRSTRRCTAGSRTSPARAACSPSPAAPTRTPSASATSSRRSSRAASTACRSSPPGRDHGYLAARPRRRRRARLRRPPAGLHRRRLRDCPTTPAARARRPRTCSPPATGGSATSATGAASTAPSSACAGTREALAAAGVPYDPALVRMELEDSAMARRATEELLSGENPPTAVFAAQNLITIGAVAALARARPAARVALVGFDDLTLADAVEPGPHGRRAGRRRDRARRGRSCCSRASTATRTSRRGRRRPDHVSRGSGEITPGGRHDSASLLDRRLGRPPREGSR